MTALFAQTDIPKVIDYLSLDVEGAETMIMSAFPFDSHTIKVMTVERPTPELKRLLQRHGYVQLGDLGNFGESLLSQRTTTAASQWYHSGTAAVPYQQHPIVKISLSTKITALSKSL